MSNFIVEVEVKSWRRYDVEANSFQQAKDYIRALEYDDSLSEDEHAKIYDEALDHCEMQMPTEADSEFIRVVKVWPTAAEQ